MSDQEAGYPPYEEPRSGAAGLFAIFGTFFLIPTAYFGLASYAVHQSHLSGRHSPAIDELTRKLQEHFPKINNDGSYAGAEAVAGGAYAGFLLLSATLLTFALIAKAMEMPRRYQGR